MISTGVVRTTRTLLLVYVSYTLSYQMQNTPPCLHSQGMALLDPFWLIAITGVPGEGVPGATLSLKRATNGCSKRAAHVGRSWGVCLTHVLTKSMPSAPSPGGGAGMVLFDPTWNSAAMGSRSEFGGVVLAISNTVHPAGRQAHGGCKLYEGFSKKYKDMTRGIC
jgi:hypothetical protein